MSSELFNDPEHEKYIRYTEYVKNITSSNDLSSFKMNPAYSYMLEHVSYKQGLKYLAQILSLGIDIKDVEEFAKMNDSLGSPFKFKFNELSFPVSSTNLRYVYQAHLILSHFRTLGNPINIVEIGGGYGGLYLAINYFNKKFNLQIDSYSIIDLPEIIELQKLYTSKFNAVTTIPLQVYSANEFGANLPKTKNLCLISSYSFSEIAMSMQNKYIENIFPHLEKGFIAWNNISVYNINGMDAFITPYLDETVPYTYYVYLSKKQAI